MALRKKIRTSVGCEFKHAEHNSVHVGVWVVDKELDEDSPCKFIDPLSVYHTLHCRLCRGFGTK